MDRRIAAARGHPAAVASLVAASIAVAVGALVAIAWMLGWLGTDGGTPTPASFASPGQQVAGTAPGVALAPGEAFGAACEKCGTVEWVRQSGSNAWEVRVRYDDGSGEVRRFSDRPRLRGGDRVHLEEGRLLRD